MESVSPNSPAANVPPDPIWAVMVVHGVGDTAPGRTLKHFVPPLLEIIGNARETGHEIRLLDELAPEPPPHPDGRRPAAPKLETQFPAHFRWVEINAPQRSSLTRAVFAEVYWADQSFAGEGLWKLLLQLFQVIFHLRFVADQGTDQDGLLPRLLRQPVFWACWLLCGAIAALHLVLLYFLLIQFLGLRLEEVTGLSLDRPGWELVVLGMGLLGALLSVKMARWTKYWGSPWRLTSSCVGVACLLLTLLALTELVTRAEQVTRSEDIGSGLIGRLLTERFGLSADRGPLLIYFAGLMFAVQVVFGAVMALAALSLALWLIACLGYAWPKAGRRALVGLTAGVGALLLQIGMWALLIPILAQVFFFVFAPVYLQSQGSPFVIVLSAAVLHELLALAIVLIVAAVHFLRWKWVCDHPSATVADVRKMPRLLIHWAVMAGIYGVFLLGGLAAAHGLITGERLLQRWFAPITLWATVVTIVVAIAAGVWGRRGLRAGGHILMDIVSHFYRRDFQPPRVFGPRQRAPLRDYYLQMKIEARFRRVLEEVLALGRIARLTVVAHSQGTVVAVDSLWYQWTAKVKLDHSIQHVGLVTMGSPFTHLYQHYFPDRYPPLFIDGQFNDHEGRGWGTLRSTVNEWINVFRVDDFIGTYIDGDEANTFPKNIKRERGGHTGYWGDPTVLTAIQRCLPG